MGSFPPMFISTVVTRIAVQSNINTQGTTEGFPVMSFCFREAEENRLSEQAPRELRGAAALEPGV